MLGGDLEAEGAAAMLCLDDIYRSIVTVDTRYLF